MLKRILFSAPFLYFVILPFVFFSSLYDFSELPKVILFISSINILIGLYILRMITQRNSFVKLQRLHYLLIILLIIYAISSLINGVFGSSFFGQYYRYQGLFTQFSLFLYLILLSGLSKMGFKKEDFGRIISFGGFLAAVFIIFQFLALNLFKIPVYTFNGRFSGNLGNPNFAGGFLALSFVFADYLRFRNIKVPFWLSLIIFFVGIILTGSRSGLLAFMVIGVFLLREKGMRWVLISVPVIMMGLVMFGVTFFWRPQSTFDNRLVIWQKGLEAFVKKPILGYGLENFSTAFQSVLTEKDFNLSRVRVDKAHNELLEVAVSSGIAGVIVYLLILKEAFFSFWKRRGEFWARLNFYLLIGFMIIASLNVVNINEYLFFYFALFNMVNIGENIPDKV